MTTIGNVIGHTVGRASNLTVGKMKAKSTGWFTSSESYEPGDTQATPEPLIESHVDGGLIRVNRQLSISKAGGHPAPFPVELCCELAKPWAKRGDICYEPFTGSGTQIINCEKEDYIFHGMELSPEYIDIALMRWQNFTGKQVIHIESGKTYEEIKQGVDNE